jgi:hypothetical protein
MTISSDSDEVVLSRAALIVGLLIHCFAETKPHRDRKKFHN